MIQVKTILLAVDVPATLEMLQKNEIHLLIIDMNNSKDKVLELLQEVKSAYVPTQSLVLVDDAHSISAAENAGASACILKGFAIQQMATVIQQIIQEHFPEKNCEPEA
jgi:DNA-binding NarL/FixJ family response regulator